MDVLRTLSSEEIPGYLSSHGLSLNSPIFFSPLHYTAEVTGRTNILRFLIDKCGAKPSTKFQGKSLLEAACKARNLDIVFMLLSKLPAYTKSQVESTSSTLRSLPEPKCLSIWKKRVHSIDRLVFLNLPSKVKSRLPQALLREVTRYI